MLRTLFITEKSKTPPAKSSTKDKVDTDNQMDMKPRDLVMVRSEEEIRATLDKNGRLRGLFLMPETYELYSKESRVHKRVERLLLESTG